VPRIDWKNLELSCSSNDPDSFQQKYKLYVLAVGFFYFGEISCTKSDAIGVFISVHGMSSLSLRTIKNSIFSHYITFTIYVKVNRPINAWRFVVTDSGITRL